MKEKRCPKCGGLMAAGFVSDNTVSFWSETKQLGPDFPLPAVPEIQQHERRPMHPISTYRCSGCGFIEWYALP